MKGMPQHILEADSNRCRRNAARTADCRRRQSALDSCRTLFSSNVAWWRIKNLVQLAFCPGHDQPAFCRIHDPWTLSPDQPGKIANKN